MMADRWKRSVDWGQTVDPSIRHETNLLKGLPKSRPSDRKAAAARKAQAVESQATMDYTTGLIQTRRFRTATEFAQIEMNKPLSQMIMGGGATYDSSPYETYKYGG